jgi:hypothetical protein
MDINLREKNWWNYINEDLRELMVQSLLLLDTAQKWEANFSETFGRGVLAKEEFRDYSFIVFPAAKAYEGFLKKLFLDMGFITYEDFNGKHFRVGKALNPSLELELRRREGVYHKIIKFCGGKVLAEKLWSCWKECRNLLFHWFPNEKNAISLAEARDRVYLIIDTIDVTYAECKPKNKF